MINLFSRFFRSPIAVWEQLPQRNRHIFLLALSIGIGQGISVLASPFLTRLYSPSDFGILTAFISVVGILSTFVTLRLEVAIPLPKLEDDARILMVIAVAISVVITLLLAAGTYFFSSFLLTFNTVQVLWPFRYMLFIGIILVAIGQIFTYWAIRRSDYRGLASTKIYQGWLSVFFQVSMSTFGAIALLIGDVLGRFAGALRLAQGGTLSKDAFRDQTTLYSRSFELLSIYRKFPLVSSFSALLNAIGQNIAPILFLSALGVGAAGAFGLVQRIFGAPVATIGQAASQVFYGEIAKIESGDFETLRHLIGKQLKILGLIGVCFFGPVYFLSEWAFSIIFSEEWRSAGKMGAILSLFYFTQFVVSPLSQVLNVIHRQDLQFLWDVLRLVLVAGAMIFSIQQNAAMNTIIWVFSLTGTFAYLLLLGAIYWSVSKASNSNVT